MTQTFPRDTADGFSSAGAVSGHGAEGFGFSDGPEPEDQPTAADASSTSGQDVAIAAIMAVAGLLLMLPAIGMMPNFGEWMADHGPYVVMLPFMLWMMLAGGLLSNGVMKIIAAARGN